MEIKISFTPEEFKSNQGKTLAELLGAAKGKTEKVKPKTDDFDFAEAEEEAEEAEVEAEEEPEVTEGMLKEAINAATKAGNVEKVKAIFAKAKAKSVAGLKTELYSKVYEALKPLGKKK